MHAVQQSRPRDLAFTVVGFFPSGEGFSDTVVASLAEEAQIRVIADLRYADDGGDLEVSCVLDASGKEVSVNTLGSHSIMSESEALDALVGQLRETIPGPATHGAGGTVGEIAKLNACLELFELVMSDAPHALDGIAVGAGAYADEDLTLQFIDSMGMQHEIIPAEALRALADKSLQLGWNPAATQILVLATRARSEVSLAVLDAVCDY